MMRLAMTLLVLIACLIIEVAGRLESDLTFHARLAAQEGYQPTEDDYRPTAYAHGVPFPYMRRFIGPGRVPTILSLYRPDEMARDPYVFQHITSRWAIDGAPLLMWNVWALIGDVVVVLVFVSGLWLVIPCRKDALGLPCTCAGMLVALRDIVTERRWKCAALSVVNATLCLCIVLIVACGVQHLRNGRASNRVNQSRDAKGTSKAIVGMHPKNRRSETRSGMPGGTRDERQDNRLGTSFVWCEPGSFDRVDSIGNGQPESHSTVRIDTGFWIGKYEVTQADWFQLMGAHPSYFDQRSSRCFDGKLQKAGISRSLFEFQEVRRHESLVGIDTAQFPVECVSWSDAVAFCKVLTDLEHRAERLDREFHYTLPTEDQWEYACRAGTSTDTAFGDHLTLRLAAYGNRHEHPEVVGSYPPNSWGLCEMHGNVEEWCRNPYEGSHVFASESPTETADSFVVRGGSFQDEEENCLSMSRCGCERDTRAPGIGFRIVLARIAP